MGEVPEYLHLPLPNIDESTLYQNPNGTSWSLPPPVTAHRKDGAPPYRPGTFPLAQLRPAPPARLPPIPSDHLSTSTDAREKLVRGIRLALHIVGIPVYLERLAKKRKEPLPGYPTLAEVLGSDPRWMMFRSFRQLQARLILEKQDEIRLLENELQERDEADRAMHPISEARPRRLCCRQRSDEEEQEVRRELFERIEKKFHEYADLLSKVRTLATFERPAEYEWEAVSRFTKDTKPLVNKELEWVHLREDIVSLRGPKEHGMLGAALEWTLNWFVANERIHAIWSSMCSAVHWPHSKSREPQEDASSTQNGKPSVQRDEARDTNQAGDSKQRAKSAFDGPIQAWLASNMEVEKIISKIICIILLLLIPVMFVVPIYTPQQIGDQVRKSIGVLVAFAVAFAFILMIGTPAKPHELWSVSAAYLAVLVVFFGSVAPQHKFGSGGGGQ